MNEIKTHQLNNGLRIVFIPSQREALYCGYVVCAGTRNEETNDYGMAHFVEHLCFKGTERRKAWQITSRLENVGGELNAYTSKQETVYYSAVLRSDFKRAAELLTDLVFCSTFPQTEINKEVGVICDEIDSYQDSPSDVIFDEFEQLMFENHSLGRDILGNKKRLQEYTTADALRFTKRFYKANNMVFFVCGNVDFYKTIMMLEKLTADAGQRESTQELMQHISTPLPRYTPQEKIVHRDTHQAHVMIGGRSFGGHDPRRHTLVLLNNILGGPGMNSRLNQTLRERSGLVYTADSYLSTYPDAGYWGVYFGCDKEDVNRCCQLVKKELIRLIDEPLSARKLSIAKRQIIGQMGISNDNLESRAMAVAKMFAHYHEVYANDYVQQKIQEITAEDLQSVAEQIYNESNLTTLVYQ